jgi:hypothetical protein
MKKRATRIGDILYELGRITPEDIQRALAYQRQSGGLFGDALVSLGLLSPEEVGFALADQYNLPFVHLRPEQIDWTVARMVPGDWAREQEMLPVMRDGSVVTVIGTAPPTEREMATVERFTRAERIEAALSSPQTVGLLIDAVYGALEPASAPVSEWIDGALAAGASVLGISVRGEQLVGWSGSASAGTVKTTIGGDWQTELAQMISPMRDADAGQIRSWPAILTAAGAMWRVECSLLRQGSAAEYALRVDAPILTSPHDAAATPELRAAVRPGTRATLRALQPDDGVPACVMEAMLPCFPGAVLSESARSLHLSDRPVAVPAGVLALQAEGPLCELIAALECFMLDALTLDVGYLDPEHVELARRVVPLVVFRELSTVSKRIHADRDICLRPDDRLLWSFA